VIFINYIGVWDSHKKWIKSIIRRTKLFFTKVGKLWKAWGQSDRGGGRGVGVIDAMKEKYQTL